MTNGTLGEKSRANCHATRDFGKAGIFSSRPRFVTFIIVQRFSFLKPNYSSPIGQIGLIFSKESFRF